MKDNASYKLVRPPIFVCGVQRSGTTLLVSMLSKHPDVQFLPQETHLFPLFWRPGGNLQHEFEDIPLHDILLNQLPKVNHGWVEAMPFLEELTTSIGELDVKPSSVEALFRYFLHFWQEKRGGTIQTGEKTPAHVYYAPRILKEFPECKILVMCRDPRAAALSELVKLKNNPRVNRIFNAFNFIVRWSTATCLSKILAQRDQVHFLRYEDLITEPRGTLTSVTNFLGLEYSEDLLDVGVTNSSFSDKLQKGIDFNIINMSRWKDELPNEVVGKVEGYLGPQMEELGYELSMSGSLLKQSTSMKNSIKLQTARMVCNKFPARFHHYNRNKKYRFI